MDKREYEMCVFSNCDFSNANLAQSIFIDCEFYNCNLSTVTVLETGFQNILFKDCKILGVRFDKCSGFAFSIKIDNCQLNHSSFFKQKLSKMTFKKSKLHEVDFTDCDLRESIFDECDLQNAIFYNTDLQKGDFRNSFNFTIDPENNKIKGAQFALETVVGLLKKYNIKIEPNF